MMRAAADCGICGDVDHAVEDIDLSTGMTVLRCLTCQTLSSLGGVVSDESPA